MKSLGLLAVPLLAVACGAPTALVTPDAPDDAVRAPLLAVADGEPSTVCTPEDSDAEDCVSPDEASPRLSDLNGFQFVLDEGQTFIVLDDVVDEYLKPGTATGLRREDYGSVSAWAPIDLGAKEVDERFPRGRELSLYADDGVVCIGTTRDAVLLYRDMSRENEDAAGFAARIGSEDPAQSTLLVAPLDVTGGDCSRAVWARPTTMSAPRTFAMDEAVPVSDAPWANLTVAALRALPEAVRIEADYEASWRPENDSGEGAEDEESNTVAKRPAHFTLDPSLSRTAQRHVDRDGGLTVTTASYDKGGSCGEWTDALWVATDAKGNVLASLRGDYGGKTLLDVDDDGALEVLSGNTLYVKTQSGMAAFGLPDAYWVCPC